MNQRETPNIIFHVPKTHVSRIKDYLSNYYGNAFKLKKNFVFLKNKSDSYQFLQSILDDEVKLWRYIYRIYFFDHVSKNYGDINKLCLENKVLRIQAYPQQLEEKLLSELDPIFNLNPTEFTHFLSVVFLEKKYFFGLSPANLFFRKPDQLEHISRSYYKLNEAFHRFNISLKPTYRILDIGAAPGGWTEFLSKHVEKVIAIDPADLQFKAKNVLHIPQKVEECINELRNYGSFDGIVCDINQDPREIARLINTLSPLCKDQAFLLMTLKLVFKGATEKLVSQTTELLKKEFTQLGIKWLLANTEFERTLHAVEKK